MSVISKVKSWFSRTFGGGSKSSSRSRASRVSNYGGGGSRSYSDYSSGRYRSDYEDRQEAERRRRQEQLKKRQATTNALSSISKRTDALSSGRSSSVASSATSTGNGTAKVIAKIEQKSKKAPPDPKAKAAQDSRDRATKLLKKIESDRKSYNKATGNRYNVDKNGLKARQAQKSQAYDAEAEKWEVKHHPKAMSASRGALSGVTFGGSELVAQRSKKRQETGAEQYYQAHKNRKAEIGGEIAGSLVGFGLTEKGATKLASKLAPKVLKEGGESVVKKLAANPTLRKYAAKEAERAGMKITDDVIERFALQRARRVVDAVGKDMAINWTTGGVMDVNMALRDTYNDNDGNFDAGDFAKHYAQNRALNYVLGGAVTLTPALRTSKGILRRGARDDALELALQMRREEGKEAFDRLYRGIRAKEAENALTPINLSSKKNLQERLGNIVRNEDASIASAGRSTTNPLAAPRIGESIDDTIARRANQRLINDYEREIAQRAAQGRGSSIPDTEIATATGNPIDDLIVNDPEARLPWADDIAQAAETDARQAIDTSPEAIQNEAVQAVKQANGVEDVVQPPRLEEADVAERSVQEEAAQAVKEDFENSRADVLNEFEAQQADTSLTAKERRRAERNAETIQMTLDQDAKKAERKALKAKKAAKAKKEDVNNFAAVDDASDMGFAKGGDAKANAEAKVEAEVNKAKQGKSDFEKQRDAAYKDMSGTDLNTDGVDKWDVNEQKELIDKNFRTTSEHTKRGYTTIAVTGDKGFKGVAHQAIENGETIVDVYHDKENLARGAHRVMQKADKEGGVNEMIKDFTEYAEGKRKLNSNEVRDQLYDVIAAVDFANANKNEPWAADLYLAACKAGAEQTSVSGLSLRMWQKMAMSSPEHRAKAVRNQILEMFNKSKGMRKELGKLGKGNKITESELKEFFKKNPALKDTLDALEKMGEATSVDEVQEMAEKALLQARKVMPMTAFDQLTQWRYVAMLSSPKTHVRNITSNIYSATLGQLRDGAASGIEDGLIKSGKLDAALKKQGLERADYYKSTGKMSGRAWKDSHVGLASGTELNRLKAKLHQAEMELGTLSPSDAKVGGLKKQIGDLESQIKTKQADYDKLVGGIKRPEAKKAQEAWLSEGYEHLVANAEKFEKRVYADGISKGAFKINDKLSRFIGNALETSDAISLERIFRERYDKILTANGWDALQKAAQGNSKEAKAAAARLKRLEEYAAQEASYIAATDTYRNYNAVSSAMSKYVSDTLFNYDAPMYKKILGGALHATMPFTKVPVNLVKRGIDYSPVGLLLSKKSLNNAISAGNITEINRACERLAEGRIGTGIAALGAGLGFIDPDGMMINTRLDKNDTLDKRKKDAGYQDYSIQAAGKNITMEWLTPTSSTLFTGVEFGRLLRKVVDTVASDNGMTFDVAELTDIPINLASSLLEPSLQLSVFQGLNNSLENVVESDNYSDTNANPWLKLGAGVFGDYARSMMPTVVGQISRAMSPYDYFVTGDTDAIYGFNSTMARVPFVSEKMFGAKTNSWGQIKNEKHDAGDYVESFAKNLLSPANINKTTWDETDDKMMELSKDLGDEIFPKNNYDRDLTFGRNNGNMNVKMSNKELAEYNVQRGKSGSDAMADALNTVVFNRWDKDEKGHYTIPHSDNITDAQRAKLIKEYDGKGIKDVVAYIIETPQFKKATPAEQKQIIKAIYGTNSTDDSDESRGAKRYAERYIAGKHGISADEYDYFNEVPRNAQELLAPAIDSGLITYKQALEFKRGAGKTYYTTDSRGEKGGTVTTRYNKKEMMAFLEKAGYSEEEAAALYNAFKQSNAKEYGSSSGRKGYRRRRYGRRWRHYGHGGSSKKAKVPTPKTIKASQFTQGTALGSTTKSVSSSKSSAKATPPTLKRVQAKIDLPTVRKEY